MGAGRRALFRPDLLWRGDLPAVLAAYDLEEGRPLRFQVLEGAQVVLLRREPEAGRARVLVNPWTMPL